MMLLNFAESEVLAAELGKLDGLKRMDFVVGRFSNGELFVRLADTLAGDACLVLGEVSPPDTRLAEFLLLCHTLKKEGAKRITAILPYLAYARQDKDKPGESLAAQWVGQLMVASGVDHVVTIDLHSSRVKDLFGIPLTNLSAAPTFAEALPREVWQDATLVAPDEGALDRCHDLLKALAIDLPLAHCRKKRSAVGVSSALVGGVGAKAVIYDDILDTGATLIAACGDLIEAGTREIIVVATHGLFTGSGWQALWDKGVRAIYCSDSVPDAKIADPRIHHVKLANAFVSYLKEDAYACS